METSGSTTALDTLIPETCLALIGKKHLGRLALVIDGDIHVVLVNYVLQGNSILFRTASNTLLAEAAPCKVTLEVDDIDEGARRGWSVSAKGICRDVADTAAAPQLATLDIDTWAPGSKPLLFEIAATELTGRHLYPNRNA